MTSCSRSTTTDGTDASLAADEILVPIKHVFEFKLPLPKGGREFEMNTTLVIFSSPELGKIVRLQDRPDEDIPDNAFLSVSPLAFASEGERRFSKGLFPLRCCGG